MTFVKNIQCDDLKNSSRRRAVKTIAGGVGALAAYHILPTNWSKPIIEQVFLPAHAAVSGISLSDPCTVELISGNQTTATNVIRVSGFVTPPSGGIEIAIAAMPNGGNGGTVVAFTASKADGTYSTEMTITGGPGIIGVAVSTGISGGRNTASCAVGTPPVEKPKPPTTTSGPTTTPSPTTTSAPMTYTIRIVSVSGGCVGGSSNYRLVSVIGEVESDVGSAIPPGLVTLLPSGNTEPVGGPSAASFTFEGDNPNNPNGLNIVIASPATIQVSYETPTGVIISDSRTYTC